MDERNFQARGEKLFIRADIPGGRSCSTHSLARLIFNLDSERAHLLSLFDAKNSRSARSRKGVAFALLERATSCDKLQSAVFIPPDQNHVTGRFFCVGGKSRKSVIFKRA